MTSLSTLVLIDPEGREHALVAAPLHVGSDAACAVRVAIAAPLVARVSSEEVEAVADCIVGSVPLGAGRRRRLAGRTTLRAGDAEMRIEQRWAVAEVSTRQLALEIVKLAPCPEVVVVEGPGGVATVSLTEEREHIVGRSRKSDLVLEDDAVSREHVALLRRGSDVLVRDLGSLQGTYLGATRLAARRKAVWHPDHMLRVGKTVLALRLPGRKEEMLESAALVEDVGAAEAPIEVMDAVHQDAALSSSDDLARSASAPPIASTRVAPPQVALGRSPYEFAVLALGGLIIVTGIVALVWLIAFV